MAKQENRNEQKNQRDSKSNTEVLNPEKKAEKTTGSPKSESDVKKVAITDLSPQDLKVIAINALKILLPVAACAIVIAVIISFTGSKNNVEADRSDADTEEHSDAEGSLVLSSDPLEENTYTDVNELMGAFFTALADGDMDTVRTLKDYSDEREIITLEEKSKFIESYDNVSCYTKPGIEENSYFVYVTYDVKIKDIETKAPGLHPWYVYTAEDGSLKIDGDMEENIKAAFKLVTNQDDVVDLYNKIDVGYKEAIASDESLDSFMTELPARMKMSVGIALAQLEEQNTESGDAQQTEAVSGDSQTAETPAENTEQPQNQTVNQTVRATATVNVRSSDSEEADKIGKAQTGLELTRMEERVNGWSKVIFEGKEAYIKSDYLEVITAEAATAAGPVGTVTASTNVNVRSGASQDSDKLGTAQGGDSYELLEDQGEWLKINYNGKTGFVKAEFFDR